MRSLTLNKKSLQDEMYGLPYHWLMKGYWRVTMEFRNKNLMKHLNFSKELKILDMGCGDGYFSTQLQQNLSKALIVGADFNLRALRFARILSNDSPFIANSVVSLAFKKETFDLIFLLDVLEHLNKVDREQALNQVLDALKPGGEFVLSVPSKNLPVIPRHYSHFSENELQIIMEKKFGEVLISGYCQYVPIVHFLTRFRIIWRILYFTIKECNPKRAVTLIGYGKKAV